MNDLVQITIMIAGRSYPLRIEKADEQMVHTMVRQVNEKITAFQAQYQQKDKQDCLAMTLLTYAMELSQTSKTKKETQDISPQLNNIESLLDDILAH